MLGSRATLRAQHCFVRFCFLFFFRFFLRRFPFLFLRLFRFLSVGQFSEPPRFGSHRDRCVPLLLLACCARGAEVEWLSRKGVRVARKSKQHELDFILPSSGIQWLWNCSNFRCRRKCTIQTVGTEGNFRRTCSCIEVYEPHPRLCVCPGWKRRRDQG